jgi:hypothetical protein
MTKRAFDKIKHGLDEASAFLDGSADKSRFRVHYAKLQTPHDKVRTDAVAIPAKENRSRPRFRLGRPT